VGDCLEGTIYTPAEKDFITKLARYLYIRFGVGRKDDVGWSVCNDEDRKRAKWKLGVVIANFKQRVVADGTLSF